MRLGFKKCILTYLGAIFLMSHIILVNNVAAFDYVSGLKFSQRISQPNIWWSDSNTPTTWRQGFYGYGGINTYGSSRWFRVSNPNRNLTTAFNDIVVISGQFYASSYAGGVVNTSGMMGIGSDQRGCSIVQIDADTVTMDNVMADELITYRKSFTITCVMNGASNNFVDLNLHLYNGGQETVSSFGINFTSLVVFKNDDSNSDITSKLNDIYTWLQNNADDAGDTLKQEKQDVQDAADDSETAAENNSESQQTDSIINVFGSFVSAVSSLQPTNCNVTLQWPASLGGNMTVNVCQNKDKAGNIVSVFGSITLLVFYIPLALKLLSMIYNEIRSFTNG